MILRWNIQRGNCVIPKSSKPHRIADNFNISEKEHAADESQSEKADIAGAVLLVRTFSLFAAFVESEGGWLNNPGFHGLGEMLYEFTSCAANNGSGFEGLGDNTWFWNVSCGIVLILSRFIPIIGQVAIAGLLAQKKYIPESAGTLKTDTVTFGVMTFAVIFIVAALSFFPAQALSTIAEHFSL